MNIKYERDMGLDIVKTVATIFVICVHFFLKTKFYETPVLGKNMYMQVVLQQTFLICVPLFMIATGYINKSININIKYYKKIIPIIVVYFVYSVLALLLRHYVDGDTYSIRSFITEILSFTGNPYSWYINMFIGLFCMAPFLNILYNSLNSKQDKRVLLIIFLMLTAIPTLFNGRFLGIIYFPSYFTGMYPISYYFIGKYINEYKPNINRFYGILILILLILIQSIIEVYFANGDLFRFYLSDYQSILRTFQALILFLLLYRMNVSNKSVRSFFTLISSLSLDIYLSSYMADRFIYSYFDKYEMIQQQYIYLFLPITLIVFLVSLFISYLRKRILKIR